MHRYRVTLPLTVSIVTAPEHGITEISGLQSWLSQSAEAAASLFSSVAIYPSSASALHSLLMPSLPASTALDDCLAAGKIVAFQPFQLSLVAAWPPLPLSCLCCFFMLSTEFVLWKAGKKDWVRRNCSWDQCHSSTQASTGECFWASTVGVIPSLLK